MSRRQRMMTKLARYRDVRSLLLAMKNMALMEIHKLGSQIERQTRLLDTVAQVSADYACFYPLPEQAGPEVCIVLGAERGFCGDFNAELVATLEPVRTDQIQILVVGRRLADRFPDQGTFANIAGATVTEEIPRILEQVALWLEKTQGTTRDLPMHVKILYQDEMAGHPVFKTILPLPVSDQKGPSPYTCRPHMTLDPVDFLAALEEQALLLSLEGYATLSLAAENRRRLDHMASALNRLDETMDDLTRKMNRARQEDIIEEIETIMLGRDGFCGGGNI
ncbi:F0F1 ATP synthase subunit gamma [Paremcibacter congregatus]|uniref:F0F1 ATP synthase subunit gamma n=1 Tax=Paremcibacter congregatus TaxID=2043170 RepID=UPI003A9192F2